MYGLKRIFHTMTIILDNLSSSCLIIPTCYRFIYLTTNTYESIFLRL
nr:MAG TPA: hypothetical protein [Caudoviricetes sp.]DAH76346.1 MAG TPA: hypothetical protein [Caudoviricetes sp.]